VVAGLRPGIRKVDVDAGGELPRQDRREEEERVTVNQSQIGEAPPLGAAGGEPEILRRQLDAEEALGGTLGGAAQEEPSLAETQLDLPIAVAGEKFVERSGVERRRQVPESQRTGADRAAKGLQRLPSLAGASGVADPGGALAGQ
jgi:hypothetical protein